MTDEYWATFSIYDHRTPLYRQALILFDRVVVPIPKATVGSLSKKEIESLSADVDFLEKHDAAVRFDWDPNEFQDWQQSVVREALAIQLNKDPSYATRLHLMHIYQNLIPPGVDSVVAMPVYQSRENYDAATEDLKREVRERLTLEIICKNIPVPADNTPLESIIDLRSQKQFQDSMHQLRKWQMQILPELLSDYSDAKLRAAGRDLERWITQYNEAMIDAKHAKLQTIAKSIASIFAIGVALTPAIGPVTAALASLTSEYFILRKLSKPCWKELADKQCAPAGVIYAATNV